MRSYLDFEKPVGELEQKIEELRAMQASGDVSVADEIERLEAKANETLTELYENLTPWQKTQVARWPIRKFIGRSHPLRRTTRRPTATITPSASSAHGGAMRPKSVNQTNRPSQEKRMRKAITR